MLLEDLLNQPPPISAAPRYPTGAGPAVNSGATNFLLNAMRAPSTEPTVSQDIQGEEITSSGRPKPEHKGAFGVKGTLRDILGILGDGLTGKMAYTALRQQEKMGDAARGFQDDPAGSIDALNQAGFAKEAMELYEQHQKQQMAQAQLARQNMNDDATRLSTLGLAQQRARSGIRGLLSSASDDATYERLLPAIQNIMGRKGLDMAGELATLPSTYTGNEETIRRWGMDPYQFARLEDADETREVQETLGKERIATTRRGQDVSASTQRRGQDMADKRVRESSAFSGGGRGRTGSIGGAPPKSGSFKGQIATSPTGQKFTWDGKEWSK